MGAQLPEPPAGSAGDSDPESELAFADSLGPAVVLLLETLAPAERVAFVLHDTFDLPFEEIAAIVGRTRRRRQAAGESSRRRRRPRCGSENIEGGKITEIELAMEPERLFELDIQIAAD